MALVYKDRVLETTSTTGTGTLTLAGAVSGYQAFSSIGTGNTCYYSAFAVDTNGNPTGDWEVGLGTYTLSGTTLARTSVYASSNSGSAVSFSAVTKRVALVAPADLFSTIALLTGADFTGKVTITKTTQQLTVAYDGSNKLDVTVSSAGNVTFVPSGGTSSFTGAVAVSGAVGIGGNTTITGQASSTALTVTVAATPGDFLNFKNSSGTLLFSCTSAPTFGVINGGVAGNYVCHMTAAIAQAIGLNVSSALSWSNGGTSTSGIDTGLSRISAGVIGVGTGAAGSVAGGIQMATLALGGATIGSDALAVTGTAAISGNLTLGVGGDVQVINSAISGSGDNLYLGGVIDGTSGLRASGSFAVLLDTNNNGSTDAFYIRYGSNGFASGTEIFRASRTGSGTVTMAGAGGVIIGTSGSAIKKVLTATAALDFGSVAAGGSAELDVTVTGAVAGDMAIVSPNGAPEAKLTWCAYAGTDKVTVRIDNSDLVSATDPASRTYRVTVLQF